MWKMKGGDQVAPSVSGWVSGFSSIWDDLALGDAVRYDGLEVGGVVAKCFS